MRSDCGCCVQRSELETLLAMERAARLAVEKAAATMSRSHASTPLHTPLRTAAKNGVTTRAIKMEMQQPLPEVVSYGVMGRHCTDVVSYASPDARCGSPRAGDAHPTLGAMSEECHLVPNSRGACAKDGAAYEAEPDHSLM